MTTAADVKRVTRLVLEREPGLILVKRTLILPPAGHYLRAFCLAALSAKDKFRIHYIVHPLYRLAADLSVGFGDYLYDDHGPWLASDPRIGERIADTLLGEGMTRIKHVDNPEAFLEYCKTIEDYRAGGDWHTFLTHLVLGRLDAAYHLGAEVLRRYYPHTDRSRHTRRFLQLMGGGQARIDRVLKSWEQTNARRLGIERYWKSPWPS